MTHVHPHEPVGRSSGRCEPQSGPSGSARSVPLAVLHTALGGFAAQVGERLRTGRGEHPAYLPLHPGDEFGHVLAWLWNHDRDLAILFLYDTTRAMHPVFRLEDLLRGALYALPNGFDDFDELRDVARVQVAQLHGRPGI